MNGIPRNNVMVFTSKVHCNKLYLPRGFRELIGIKHGDTLQITVYGKRITVKKVRPRPRLGDWIIMDAKQKYASGFKYCGRCGVWVKPVEQVEFNRCPLCNTTLRSRRRR